MRVATFNIRNGRALDLSSFWWTRRRALARVIERIDADIWGFQEAYGFQRRFLERTALPAAQWRSVGAGRAASGGGEQVPVFHRRTFTEGAVLTRWFGPTPDDAGTMAPGARRPRIATIAELGGDGAPPLRVVNLHLDSDSEQRRAESIVQLGAWLSADETPTPTIVLGDFNGELTDPGYEALADCGLRSALPADAGPTSNGFGRALGSQRQIDHVFVSAHFAVRAAWIDHDAGHASDHFPVVVDLNPVDVSPSEGQGSR